MAGSRLPAGTWRITSVKTGTAITRESNDSGRLVQGSRNFAGDGNQPRQNWIIEDAEDGASQTVRSQNNPDAEYLYTDAGVENGSALIVSENKLYWVIEQANNDAGFTIKASGTNFVADLENGSSSDGAKIQLYEYSAGNTNQLWNFTQV